MAKFDWYKRNPAKFIGGTVGMAWDVKCVYSVIVDLVKDGGGSCADDGPWIANILGVGMSVRHWNIIKAKLIAAGKLAVRDGRIYNTTASGMAENEDLSRVETTESRGNVPGKNKDKSPDKSPVNDGTLFPDNGLGTLATPKSQDLPARARESQSQIQKTSTRPSDVVVEVERIAEALGQKKGKYWATDYGRMIDDGLTFDDLMAAARAHSGGEIKSLNALRGLARKKRDDRMAGGGRAEPSHPPAEGMTAMQWSPYLALFLKQGVWDEDRFGPPPSRGGCRVPIDLLKAVITAWAKQGGTPREERDLSGNVVAYPSSQPDPQRRAMWEPEQ